MKRLLDLLLAALGLLLTSPVQALIALAVRLDSRGPVLFRQVRVGRAGQPFEILKFRTMTAGAVGAAITTKGDARVTRVGRVLRSTKLDELPQLWNVLVGEMSLVGPRPEVPQYVALWPSHLRDKILSVRPGITDPASIEFRDEGALLATQVDPERYYREVLLPLKAQTYAEYVDSASLRGDLVILGQTIRAILR